MELIKSTNKTGNDMPFSLARELETNATQRELTSKTPNPLFKEEQNGSINSSSFHSKLHIIFKQEAHKKCLRNILSYSLLCRQENPNGDNDHYIKHMALFFKLANYLIMLLFLQKENALPPPPTPRNTGYQAPPPPESFLVDVFLLRVTYASTQSGLMLASLSICQLQARSIRSMLSMSYHEGAPPPPPKPF